MKSKSSKDKKRMSQNGKGKRNRKHPFDDKVVLSCDGYDKDIRKEYTKYHRYLKYLTINGCREVLIGATPGSYRKVKHLGSE